MPNILQSLILEFFCITKLKPKPAPTSRIPATIKSKIYQCNALVNWIVLSGVNRVLYFHLQYAKTFWVLSLPISCINSTFLASITFLTEPKWLMSNSTVFGPIPSILSNEVPRLFFPLWFRWCVIPNRWASSLNCWINFKLSC